MIWGVVLSGVANGWRAIGLSQQRDLLLDLGSSLNPSMGIGLALVWSIILVAAAAALWQRQRWTRLAIPILLLMHGIYQLSLIVLFAQSADSQNSWPAVVLQYMLAVLFSVWALCRPAVSWYFER
jgi:hypothetical protein